MPAGTGVSGDDCRGGPNGSRACAVGLVCNGSICQALCEPDGMPCEDRARYADIPEAVERRGRALRESETATSLPGTIVR